MPEFKKVLIITYYWPPSGGAGVQRWLKFTKYLPGFGIHPIVLTVSAEKATYPLIDASLEKDVSGKVQVHRTQTREILQFLIRIFGKSSVPYGGFVNQKNKSQSGKLSRWIRGNLFIPDPRKSWNRFALKKARQILEKEDICAIVTTSPPHSSQLIGLQLRKEFQIPWIADLRDPWTDIYYFQDLLPNSRTISLHNKYERLVLESADRIVTVSEGLKKLFISKSHSLIHDKIEVVHNGFDEEDFRGLDIRQDPGFTITYTGTITEKYFMDQFFKAFGALIKQGEMKGTLRFVGEVSDSVRRIIDDFGILEHSEFTGHVSHRQSIAYLLRSSVLLLGIPYVANNEGILTGKIFEYLGAGRPIMMIGPIHGDAARIISDSKAGKAIDYENQDGIRVELLNMYKLWQDKQNGQSYPADTNKFSRQALTKQIVRIIESNSPIRQSNE